MRRFLLRWIVSAASAYVAMRLVAGFRIEGGWTV